MPPLFSTRIIRWRDMLLQFLAVIPLNLHQCIRWIMTLVLACCYHTCQGLTNSLCGAQHTCHQRVNTTVLALLPLLQHYPMEHMSYLGCSTVNLRIDFQHKFISEKVSFLFKDSIQHHRVLYVYAKETEEHLFWSDYQMIPFWQYGKKE